MEKRYNKLENKLKEVQKENEPGRTNEFETLWEENEEVKVEVRM